jgi:hypothetical protein
MLQRNVLDVAERHGANSPLVNNLHDPLRCQGVSVADLAKRPASDEIQAHHPPLNVGPRLLLEGRNLLGEAYPPIPDS